MCLLEAKDAFIRKRRAGKIAGSAFRFFWGSSFLFDNDCTQVSVSDAAEVARPTSYGQGKTACQGRFSLFCSSCFWYPTVTISILVGLPPTSAARRFCRGLFLGKW